MTDYNCPACGGSLLAKYGKTGAGKQKFKCLDPSCRRQFVAGSKYLIDEKTKATIMELLAAGVHPKQIAAAYTKGRRQAESPVDSPGSGHISKRWIYELRRRMRRNDQHNG
jgi:transposase-like protein